MWVDGPLLPSITISENCIKSHTNARHIFVFHPEAQAILFPTKSTGEAKLKQHGWGSRLNQGKDWHSFSSLRKEKPYCESQDTVPDTMPGAAPCKCLVVPLLPHNTSSSVDKAHKNFTTN